MRDLMSMFMDAESRVEVRHQDAIALLRSLKDESVDLVLTDPPYGISYQSNYRKGEKPPRYHIRLELPGRVIASGNREGVGGWRCRVYFCSLGRVSSVVSASK